MELSTARRLAWAAEFGGASLPADVAARVGSVMAKGAEVTVAPNVGMVIEPEVKAQA